MPAAPAAAAAEVAAEGAGGGDTGREEETAMGDVDVVGVLRLALALVGGEGALGGLGCRTDVVAGAHGAGLPAPVGGPAVGAVAGGEDGAGVEARAWVKVTVVLARTRLSASAMMTSYRSRQKVDRCGWRFVCSL